MTSVSFFKFLGTLGTASFFSMSAIVAQAQSPSDNTGLLKRCGGYFGLCGYISEPDWMDDRIETEVLPKIYEALGEYSEGLAPVRVKGRWGFMDRNGEMKIEPAYTSVSPFDHGLAVVGTKTGYGLIDRSGALLLPADFKWMVIYNQHRVLASRSDEITFNPFRRVQGYPKRHFPRFNVSDSPPAGIYDISSGWLTSQTLKFQNFDALSNTHIWAREDSKSSQYGLLNTVTGDWQVKPIYDEVRPASDGRAIVGSYIDGKPKTWGNKRYGAVNESGTLIIPMTFDHFNDFWNGFGETRKDGKIALVAKSGNLVADKYFEDAKYERADFTQRMVKDDGVWWKVWPNGTLHPEEGWVFLTCPSGLSFEAFMERSVITHPDGDILGEDFQSPTPNPSVRGKQEGEHRCKKPISVKGADGKWGFISPAGEFLGGGVIYENTISFKDGQGGRKYAGFEKEGLWGIMNDEGETLHEPQFKSTEEVLENIPGYISETPRFERGSKIMCSAGSRLFTSNGKWGLQDEAGRVLVKAEHDLLTCFSLGTAFVPDYELKQWCPIDREGQRRSDLPCKDYMYTGAPSHHAPEKLDPDPWLSNLKWIRQNYEYGLGLREDKPKFIRW